MSEHAVCVTGVNMDEELELTLPFVKKYCTKYDLDLITIDTPELNVTGKKKYNYLKFEKNQVYNYFDQYNRILRLDADLLISPQCPNVFDIVPQDEIGGVFEDVGSRLKNRRNKQIRAIKKVFGDLENWESGYVNAGVLVVSSQHRELFQIDSYVREVLRKNRLGAFQEQNILNWKIRKTGFRIRDLGYKFNHMSMFSEPWHGNKSKYDSFILHIAGGHKKSYRKLKKDAEILQRMWEKSEE